MNRIYEERYVRSQINVQDKINDILKALDLNEYSVEFFVSKEFLVIKIYQRF